MGPRCRCRVGPGRYEVQARIERFVEPSVLLLLNERPRHGYELAEELESFLGDARVDFGNLYRLLRSLEAEGLVSSTWDDEQPGPIKRIYELTSDGRALLSAWAESLHASKAQLEAFLEAYERSVKKAENT